MIPSLCIVTSRNGRQPFISTSLLNLLLSLGLLEISLVLSYHAPIMEKMSSTYLSHSFGLYSLDVLHLIQIVLCTSQQ